MTLLSVLKELLQVLEVDTVGDVTQHGSGASTDARLVICEVLVQPRS